MEAGVQHFDLGGLFNSFDASTPDIVSDPGYNNRISALRGNQSQVYGQQQDLAKTLLQQSQGLGPNLAQAQLAQSTNQNVANQAAMMASQRGAAANPALMARQAAMVGAQQQQNSAGQAATLRAQQILGAQQHLGQMYGTMGEQAGQQESGELGARAAENTVRTQGGLGSQQLNANAAGQNSQMMGNILGAVGAVGAMALLNKGGPVQKLGYGGMAHFGGPDIAMPGMTSYKDLASDPIKLTGGAAKAGGVGEFAGGPGDTMSNMDMGNSPMGSGLEDVSGGMAGGNAFTMLAANGGKIPSQALLDGGSVPGQAEVSGDSKKNDTQLTLLSPGEIVLPRSVTQGGNLEAKAVEFLRHLKTNNKGYAGVLDAKKACGGKV